MQLNPFQIKILNIKLVISIFFCLYCSVYCNVKQTLFVLCQRSTDVMSQMLYEQNMVQWTAQIAAWFLYGV